MKVVADLHLHSRFARATSVRMNLEEMERWAIKKGIHLLGTGDITHPVWFSELKTKLQEREYGFYSLSPNSPVRFVLSGEISCVYSKEEKVRKIHIVLIIPTLEELEKLNAKLSWIGNLKSDGRPTLGLDAKELVKIVKEVSPNSLVIPAHIWTPWFSLFGSKSGFDSVEECFEEETSSITALETGLSSDPPMNWRLSALDRFSLVSNSDSHSPERLGREANVFDLKEMSLLEIKRVLEEKDASSFLYTIEFFPEEGKYHYDGHRFCGVGVHPQQTKEWGGICPKCHKPLTVGVLHRVEELADRPEGYVPQNAIPYRYLIPLLEILAQIHDSTPQSAKVQKEYERLVTLIAPEIDLLLEVPLEVIEREDERLAVAIGLLREEKVERIPGYDGEYGIIKVSEKELQAKGGLDNKKKKTLF